MQYQQADIQKTPEVFKLQKLQPDEITDDSSRIYCDGHFFPTSISGVPASDYGQSIYKLIEVDTNHHHKITKEIAHATAADMAAQPLYRKLCGAIAILSQGVNDAGLASKSRLMHPLTEFSDNDVQAEASLFLQRTLGALIKHLSQTEADGLISAQLESTLFLD